MRVVEKRQAYAGRNEAHDSAEAPSDALFDALKVMGLDDLDPDRIAYEFRNPPDPAGVVMDGIHCSLHPGVPSMRPPQVCAVVPTRRCASFIVQQRAFRTNGNTCDGRRSNSVRRINTARWVGFVSSGEGPRL